MYRVGDSVIALGPLSPSCPHGSPRAPAQGHGPLAQLANIIPGHCASPLPSNFPAFARAAPLPRTLFPSLSSQIQPRLGGVIPMPPLS